MRMKRRPDKGEMFTKSLCCARCSDSENESGDNDKTKNIKMNKYSEKQEAKGKVVSEKERKEAKKGHEKENELSRKERRETLVHRKDLKEDESNLKPRETNFAIISKSRITRSLGIYNKAKRSDTIQRECVKQKLCRKKFDDINSATAKDMARILDCSSFHIRPSSTSVAVCNGEDSPIKNDNKDAGFLMASPASRNRTHSSCSSSGTNSHTGVHKNSRVTPLSTMTPQRKTPQNEAMLAFKTPLQELSETLTEGLKPSETFNGRNYFAEVQGQLRKMYKQSSLGTSAQKKTGSLDIASEVQRRCLKRKSLENASENETLSSRSKSSAQGDKDLHSSEWLRYTGREKEPTYCADEVSNSNRLENTLLTESRSEPNSSHYSMVTSGLSAQLDIKENCQIAEIENKERQIEDKEGHFVCGRAQKCSFGTKDSCFLFSNAQNAVAIRQSSAFDILDFLDGCNHQSHFQENQHPQKEYMTPDLRQISPPKKPTLESPTPRKMFYPRKLY